MVDARSQESASRLQGDVSVSQAVVMVPLRMVGCTIVSAGDQGDPEAAGVRESPSCVL